MCLCRYRYTLIRRRIDGRVDVPRIHLHLELLDTGHVLHGCDVCLCVCKCVCVCVCMRVCVCGSQASLCAYAYYKHMYPFVMCTCNILHIYTLRYKSAGERRYAHGRVCVATRASVCVRLCAPVPACASVCVRARLVVGLGARVSAPQHASPFRRRGP